jgi:hypothetical protein
MEQARRMVFAFEITGHLAAQEAARDGVLRVAAKLRPVPVFIHVNEERTGVRAIEGADRVDGAGHNRF